MSDQQRQLFLAAFAAMAFVSILGLLKIINIPNIPPFVYQATLLSIVATIGPAGYIYLENQKELERIQLGLKRSLYQQGVELATLNSENLVKQVKSYLRQIEQSLESRLEPSKGSIKLKTSLQNPQNIILASLALRIMRMGEIKFKDRIIKIEKKDLVFITQSSEARLEVVIQKTNSYLRQLQKRFADSSDFSEFLYQLLADNNMFLDAGVGLDRHQGNFNKALQDFHKDRQSDSKSKTAEIVQPKKQTPYLRVEDLTAAHFPETSPLPEVGEISLPSTAIPKEDLLKFVSDKLTIEEVLSQCRIGQNHCQIIYLDDKLELRIDSNKLGIFAKILNEESVLHTVKMEDDAVVLSCKSKNLGAQMRGFKTSIVAAYKATEEYKGLEDKILKRASKITKKFRDEKNVSRKEFALAEWRQFSDRQQKLESALLKLDQPDPKDFLVQWHDSALQNHQQFADFLNQAKYLGNFANLGNIRLKGSYLYGNLLALSKVQAQDIDLEIAIPDLFSVDKSAEDIKQLIQDNFDFPIDDSQIKVGKDQAGVGYARFELVDHGQKVDLSFYDSKKMPVSDWIFSVDALRKDLTKVLKSDQPINCDQLLTTKLSLGNGFLVQHPNTNIDDVLTIIKSGAQLVNTKARDLVFNTVKKIKNGLIKIEKAQSLYFNNEDFKKAFDESWSLAIRNLDNFRERCKNAGIEGEELDRIVEQIKTPLSRTPQAGITTTYGVPLKNPQQKTATFKSS